MRRRRVIWVSRFGVWGSRLHRDGFLGADEDEIMIATCSH